MAPSKSKSEAPVGPGGTFFSSNVAEIRFEKNDEEHDIEDMDDLLTIYDPASRIPRSDEDTDDEVSMGSPRDQQAVIDEADAMDDVPREDEEDEDESMDGGDDTDDSDSSFDDLPCSRFTKMPMDTLELARMKRLQKGLGLDK